MDRQFLIFPDDRTNEFGSANDLSASGSVFDFCNDDQGSAPDPNVRSGVVQSDETRNSVIPSDEIQSGSVPSDEAPSEAENIHSPSVSASEADPVFYKSESALPPASGKTAVETAVQKNKRGSKGKVYGILVLLLLFSAAACAVVYFCTHAIFGSLTGRHAIVSYNAVEINLSGSDYGDYSALSGMKSLETLDLTNSSFSRLSDLYGCRSLKKVILGDRELSAEECIDFYSHLPAAHIVCRVNINGTVYDSGIVSLKAEKTDQETQRLYAALKNLKHLDMVSCVVSDDTYDYLAGVLPDCRIIIKTTIGGREYTTDAQELVLEGLLTDEDAARLGCFRDLKSLNLKKCKNPELLDEFLSLHTGITVNRSVTLLDRQVGTEDEMADLRRGRYKLKDVMAALNETLPKMKKLKKIDMCGCGLSDKDMEKLCDAFPEIQFVWAVSVGEWSVRTDAVVFSVRGSEDQAVYDQSDFEPLFRYCTDLAALDLGGCMITDITDIGTLKKLRAICLENNPVSDISAFSQLSELEFIEMDSDNQVKNADSLRGLNNLRFVNFWSNGELTDLSPLYDHENLEMAIFHYTVPQNERKWFKKSNPKCSVYYSLNENNPSPHQKWIDNPYRKKLRKAFDNWKNAVGFDESKGEFVFDSNTDQYKNIK